MANHATKDQLGRDPDHLDWLIDEHHAALILGYSVRTLQNWRVRGGGPKFIRVSARSIRYRRRELIEWADANIRCSTSDTGQQAANDR